MNDTKGKQMSEQGKLNILLYSRCNLVHLHGQISKHLEKEYNVIHLAYSEDQELILRDKYGVTNILRYCHEYSDIKKTEQFDPDLCATLDKQIAQYTDGEFSLNSAIQSDRTFSGKPYLHCLIESQIFYKTWAKLFDAYDIDVLIHEANSLLMNQMASVVAKERGSHYFTFIQVRGFDKYSWLLVDAANGTSPEICRMINKTNLDNSEHIVSSYKRLFMTPNDLNGIFHNRKVKHPAEFAWHAMLSSTKAMVRSIQKCLKTTQKGISDIEDFLSKRPTVFSSILKEYFYSYKVRYDALDRQDKYYFYPIHIEPEAVVLYWAGGWYKNQIKLIENIAAQLPAHTWLYVKDHPYSLSYRSIGDYHRLRAIPNVKLIDPRTNSIEIIKNSTGVITINGTSGFEALVLGKAVYTFGSIYYNCCSNVTHVRHIKNLGSIISDKESNWEQNKDKREQELARFVAAFSKSIHPGFTAFFSNYAEKTNMDISCNAEIVADGFIKALRVVYDREY